MSASFDDYPITQPRTGECTPLLSGEAFVCHEAIAELQRLGQEMQLDPQELENLTTAIDSYATTIKPEPISDMEMYGEVGRCMTVPLDFRRFCKETLNLDVDTGAYIARSSERGSINFYHEVNVVNGIIIDWTAKQFSQDRDKPYPLVYANGGNEVRASWVPLEIREF